MRCGMQQLCSQHRPFLFLALPTCCKAHEEVAREHDEHGDGEDCGCGAPAAAQVQERGDYRGDRAQLQAHWLRVVHDLPVVALAD